MKRNKWTDEELILLETYYPVGGYRLCQEKGLNRTVDSIQLKAKSRKCYCRPNYGGKIDWTEEEIAIISDNYEKGGVLLCIEKGVSHSASAIHYKASIIGLKVGKGKAKRKTMWDETELSLLTTYYPKGGPKLCKEKGLNRTINSIVLKANELGVNRSFWSDEDLEILHKYYEKGGSRLCKSKGLLFARTTINIKAKSEGLEYKKGTAWTTAEDDILKKYYEKGGYNLCVQNGLKRSSSAVYTRISRVIEL